jgi:hypothetical protein
MQAGHSGPASDRPGDLREDVGRVAVARMLQRPVARRIDRLQALALEIRARDRVRHLHEHGSAFDADALGRHAYPRVAGAGDLLLRAHPFGIGVDATADVEPLDDDGAAERPRLRRRAHQHARAVGRARVGRERPATVAGQRAGTANGTVPTVMDAMRRMVRCGDVIAIMFPFLRFSSGPD